MACPLGHGGIAHDGEEADLSMHAPSNTKAEELNYDTYGKVGSLVSLTQSPRG